jgi:atypical dual specificity phosphatase
VIRPAWLKLVEVDPNLRGRGIRTEAELHARMRELSAAIKDSPSSVFRQVTFSGRTACPLFAPNPFKADVGQHHAGVKVIDYHRYAVKSDTDLKRALEFLISAKPSTIIAPAPGGGRGGLWLGGYKAVTKGFKFMAKKHRNVTSIVNTAKDLGRHFRDYPNAVKRHGENQGRRFLHIPWSDSPDQTITMDQLRRIVAFIHSTRLRGEGVLVHCAQGKSRSGTAVVAYVGVLSYGLRKRGGSRGAGTFEGALAYVQSKRGMVQPNAGFRGQLSALAMNGAFRQLYRDVVQVQEEALKKEGVGGGKTLGVSDDVAAYFGT